jgi:hypothetical protein
LLAPADEDGLAPPVDGCGVDVRFGAAAADDGGGDVGFSTGAALGGVAPVGGGVDAGAADEAGGADCAGSDDDEHAVTNVASAIVATPAHRVVSRRLFFTATL